MTKIFNKGGLASAENRDKADLVRKVEQTIKSRIAAYQMPERSAAQRKLLQPFLPSQCR